MRLKKSNKENNKMIWCTLVWISDRSIVEEAWSRDTLDIVNKTQNRHDVLPPQRQRIHPLMHRVPWSAVLVHNSTQTTSLFTIIVSQAPHGTRSYLIQALQEVGIYTHASLILFVRSRSRTHTLYRCSFRAYSLTFLIWWKHTALNTHAQPGDSQRGHTSQMICPRFHCRRTL